VVERVVATGHEPRRFVEDLLERLRDLIVLAAAGDAAGAALGMIPSDQLDRMRAQAAHLGAAELSRSADLANAALTEMAGATSPRPPGARRVRGGPDGGRCRCRACGGRPCGGARGAGHPAARHAAHPAARHAAHPAHRAAGGRGAGHSRRDR
jgi:hypothetical protein